MNLVLLFLRRYLFSRRSGSVVKVLARLCILSLAIGVAALIVVTSVMNGFGSSLRERLLKVEPHILFYPTQPLTEFEVRKLGADLQNIVNEKVPPILRLQVFETQDIILKTKEGYFSGVQAKGLASIDLQSLFDRLTNEASDQIQPKEVAIGFDLARSLHIFEGDYVTFISPETLLQGVDQIPIFEKVQVTKILRTNLPDVDARGVFYPRGQVLQRTSRDNASRRVGVELSIPDPMMVLKVVEQLKSYEPFQKLKLTSETWMDRNSSLLYSLKAEKYLMTAFLSLTIFIALFSVVIVLSLLSALKRRDLGLLMACGFSKKNTQQLWSRLGFLLSSLGVGLGVFVGLILCWLGENTGLLELPDVYYDQRVPFLVDPVWIFAIVVGGLCLSWGISRLAAKSVVKLDPVEALR